MFKPLENNLFPAEFACGFSHIFKQETMKTLLLLFVFAISINVSAQTENAEINRDPAAAKIVTSDIALFWKAFDKATRENDLIVYRDEYLKKGSAGLKEFWRVRIENSCELVNAINYAPKYYAATRGQTAKLDSFEPRIRSSFQNLKEIYPDAVFPDVYFLVGRMNSGGTLTRTGLLIGVEMYAKTGETDMSTFSDWHKAVLGSMDRIPFIVAHELVHYQQDHPADDQTLLRRSVSEGAADFIATLIAGGHSNRHLHEYGDPKEAALWNEFKTEMLGNDVSNWLYQGDEAKDRPADLGYYIGFKIAESFFDKSSDKKAAVKKILEIKDFKKFLADSGYEEKFK